MRIHSRIMKRTFAAMTIVATMMVPLTAAILSAGCSNSGDSDGDSTKNKTLETHDPKGKDDDNQMVHTFVATSGASKVTLDLTKLTSSSGASNVSAKAAAADAVVPAGLPLTVVIDKSCLQNAGLSMTTRAKTKTREVRALRIQAYNLTPESDKRVSDLVNEADQDNCVLEVSNEVRVSVGPHPAATDRVNASQIPNDPGFSIEGHLTSIKAPESWNTFLSPGRGITEDVTVAVVDTGIDYSHPDLAANMWTADDGTHGTDLQNGDDDPMDDNEHGTHVAGLIGATMDNKVGISGVMGKHIKLMAVKVLDNEGSGSSTNVVNGIRWAVDHGAEVINMSLELAGTAPSYKQALTYASQRNVVVTVAAGNSNKEITAAAFVAPAGYCADTPGAIAVASIDSDTQALSTFSNYSSNYVGIAAPGAENSPASKGVVSTVPNGLYARLEGTSMATPVVAGSAALVIAIMKSNGIDVSNSAVISVLKSSAALNNSLTGKVNGTSSLDLDRLARMMKWRYLVDDDGGTESIF